MLSAGLQLVENNELFASVLLLGARSNASYCVTIVTEPIEGSPAVPRALAVRLRNPKANPNHLNCSKFTAILLSHGNWGSSGFRGMIVTTLNEFVIFTSLMNSRFCIRTHPSDPCINGSCDAKGVVSPNTEFVWIGKFTGGTIS
jgi:hypothetical protein